MSLQNPTEEEKKLLLNLDLSGINRCGTPKFDMKKWSQKWRDDNRERVHEIQARYRKKHREKLNKNAREYFKDMRIKAKNFVHAYKTTKGCEICGYSESPYSLDFHHKDGNKKFNISQAIGRGYTVGKIRLEMERCTLLCRNCHGELNETVANKRRYKPRRLPAQGEQTTLTKGEKEVKGDVR